MARLVGFIANRPDLCNRFADREQRVLRTRAPERSSLSWGVGFRQSGEILLKRRPLDERRELSVAEMIEDVRSDILIVQARHATVGALSTANTHPFRYAQWLFADTGTIAGFPQVGERLHGSLPRFLQRALRGETDSEMVFHLFLSFLHDAGKLDRSDVPPEECASALKATLALVDRMCTEQQAEVAKLNILLASPDHLIAVRRGAAMAYRVLSGRDDFEPLYEDEGPDRLHMPALEPCRLAVVASNFEGEAPSDGWTEVPEGSIMAFSRMHEPATVATI